MKYLLSSLLLTAQVAVFAGTALYARRASLDFEERANQADRTARLTSAAVQEAVAATHEEVVHMDHRMDEDRQKREETLRTCTDLCRQLTRMLKETSGR